MKFFSENKSKYLMLSMDEALSLYENLKEMELILKKLKKAKSNNFKYVDRAINYVEAEVNAKYKLIFGNQPNRTSLSF